MVNFNLRLSSTILPAPRVCAVSYLNTVPLVWGMLHGAQRDAVELSFAVPSLCAERVVRGEADLGLTPVVEMDRHGLTPVSGLGIACRGEVRSILLFARKPWHQIRTLAADAGSRTSVELARIVLARQFGSFPAVRAMAPGLETMLAAADAALLIGDAALQADPARAGWACLDLGAEWLRMTGLPMVFAVWAGRPARWAATIEPLLEASYAFGQSRMSSIIELEADKRGFPRQLVRDYFDRHVIFRLGDAERAGLALFLRLARALDGRALETEALAHDQQQRSS